ncbi:MAG: hypothetical protein AAGD04_09135 [Pseudomonadota bacterium]
MIRFALAFILCAGAAQAQSVKLSGAEISELLSGNTALGLWEGNAYRQYFDPGGSTIYAQEGARSALGKWRVEDDEFQSLWPRDADWEGWFVMEYAGQWFWVSKTTPPTPFEVLKGQQLVESAN